MRCRNIDQTGKPRDRKTALERFDNFVPDKPDNGCWFWIGAIHKKFGYGIIWETIGINKTKRLQAHRVAWEKYIGPIPDGYQVGHRCDNLHCVNPKHLRCAKHAASQRLRITRKHVRYGDNHWSTKLSDKHVDLIRKAYEQGRDELIEAVAKQCGTDLEYTRRVARGNSRPKRKVKIHATA